MQIATRILIVVFSICVTGQLSKSAVAEDATLPPLHAASRDGDAEEVKKQIGDGADLDAAIKGGRTPLILAAEKGHSEVLKLLLEVGADPNHDTTEDEKDLSDWPPPLHIAVRRGDKEHVKLLLERGADIRSVHTEPGYGTVLQESPLHVAVQVGNLAIVVASI